MRKRHQQIMIRGAVHADAEAAAAALGVTASTVRRAVRLGRLDRVGLGPGGAHARGVTIRGVHYPTCAAAAEALGVSESAVRHGLRQGTLHRVGTGRVGPEPLPVRIGGTTYGSAAEASRALGIKITTIYAAIADGDPDRLVRPPRYRPARARPVEIGPVRFASMREAARELGFANPEFVSKALKHGSRRGRERIIAAAMAYAQKGASA